MTIEEAIERLHAIKGLMWWERWTTDCKAVEIAIQALEEIQKYRAIGTIEEFKALKEKSVEKKLRENDECIRCGNELWMLRDTGAKYCQYCGQKLDWQ